VAETLLFYATLAEAQDDLLHRFPQVIGIPAHVFAERLDPGAALRALPPIVDIIAREAPVALGERVPELRDLDFDRWRHRIETYWITGGREAWDADAIQRFVLDALLQPFAEMTSVDVPNVLNVSNVPEVRCQVCSGVPVVSMLREHGHGAKRSLVCGFCLTEWPAPRLVCIQCGESRFEALPVFRTDEFDAVRVDACDSCKNYVKTIDLTRAGDASPIVDDVASLPLDLWAREKGYRRARHNLFGF
jgi:formate dehydrogenase maturation protein FdhE